MYRRLNETNMLIGKLSSGVPFGVTLGDRHIYLSGGVFIYQHTTRQAKVDLQ